MFCQQVLKILSDMATSYNATKHCNVFSQNEIRMKPCRHYNDFIYRRSFKIESNVKFDVEWVCMVEELFHTTKI